MPIQAASGNRSADHETDRLPGGLVDVTQLVDSQRIGWFIISLVALCFLAMFGDGYDIGALAYAAPDLVRDWHLPHSALGPAFSASLFGILLGAPLLGIAGDRLGRKKAIVASCLIYGVFSVGCAFAASLQQMVALRFLVGVGLGGVMPNTIALNAEFAPKRARALMVIIMYSGITLGGAAPGFVSAWLVPRLGWPALFLVGGAGPILISLLLAALLPESIKFLARAGGHDAQIARLAARMKPGIPVPPDARFCVPQQTRVGSLSPGVLFASGLAVITPLLWLLFAANLMAYFFLSSWMPLLFQSVGIGPAEAAIATAMYQLGGMMGSMIMGVFLDRFGFLAVTVMYMAACPVVAHLGTPGLADAALMISTFLAGFCVLGLQSSLGAAAGVIYPTEFRSKGVGWANAVGRFGSICGPLIGGMLLAMHVPVQRLFLAPVVPLAVAALGAAVLTRVCLRRFDGLRLDDAPSSRLARAAQGTTEILPDTGS